MRRTSELAACAAVLLACSTTASAAITFHSTEVAFDAAVATGFTFLGTEDFEQSTLGPADVVSLPGEALTPGVANGVFTTGASSAPGVVLASNTDGTSAVDGVASVPTLASAGMSGLSTASAGFFGTPTDQLSVVAGEHSLDILFLPAHIADPVTAVSLAPLFFDYFDFGVDDVSSVFVEVYDALGVFAGDFEVTDVDYGANTALEFIGIVATGGMSIGRINLADPNALAINEAGAGAVGVDNISVYTAQVASVPEAGSGVLAGLVLALLAVGRQRRRGTG